MPDAPDESTPLEFTDAPTYHRLSGLLLGGVSFVIANLSLAAGSWIAGTLAVLFGVQSALYLRLALWPEVRASVTEQGIVLGNRSGSPAVIDWSEVLDVTRSRFGRIEIRVRDEVDVWRRMPWWPRWRREHFSVRPGPVVLEGWRLSPDTESLLRALEDGMDRYAIRAIKAQADLPGLPPEEPRGAAE